VEVACSESWAEAVSGQIGSLHEALDARGLAPAVRARTLG
jgi:hypothetical protein